MPNAAQRQRAVLAGCRFVVLDPENGHEAVSHHKTLDAARRAAWRFFRASTERPEWPEAFEAELRPGLQSIGIERESFALFGTIEAAIDERIALGLQRGDR